ncbi:restriction endonuclease subunit S [Clostridium perfringens]|nr:restriction endonuclease subunit S [Clostridium perfringens]MDM0640561.1 restriction endonuclease subunit S [Clostridium perfringens]
MKFKLEDLCEFQKGYAFKSKDFVEDGEYIVKVTNLTSDSVEFMNCVKISYDKAQEYEKYKLNNKDIIITTVGSWPNNPNSIVGKVVRVPNIKKKAFLNQNAVRVRGININQEFLYYLLRDKKFSDYLIATAQGSASQASITQKDIKDYIVDIPNNNEQKAIAKILSDLDEKIEVNNKINKNLEEMAQAIFKQWFVDFEFPNEEGKPYKSSGGEMVKSELGMIPKGWKIFKLGDFIKFIKGKKPKKIEEKFFDGCELYLTIDVLNRNSEIFANKDKIIEVNDDDILMVMDGASSGSLYYGLNGILGSTLAKISVLNTIDKSFLYYYLKLNESSIKSHLTGSAIPHTDKEFINKLCLAIPNDEMILKKADTILNNIRNHTINLNTECSKIKKVRDTLLPKLMSGEIRVPLENSEN